MHPNSRKIKIFNKVCSGIKGVFHCFIYIIFLLEYKGKIYSYIVLYNTPVYWMEIYLLMELYVLNN